MHFEIMGAYAPMCQNIIPKIMSYNLGIEVDVTVPDMEYADKKCEKRN
jgi:hypothetical protein